MAHTNFSKFQACKKVGVTPVPAQKVSLPLVEECKAHLEYIRIQHVEYGEEAIFMGEVVTDRWIKQRWNVMFLTNT